MKLGENIVVECHGTFLPIWLMSNQIEQKFFAQNAHNITRAETHHEQATPHDAHAMMMAVCCWMYSAVLPA